jgi:hypothetical protein
MFNFNREEVIQRIVDIEVEISKLGYEYSGIEFDEESKELVEQNVRYGVDELTSKELELFLNDREIRLIESKVKFRIMKEYGI